MEKPNTKLEYQILPIQCKDVPELVAGVDVGGHAEAEHDGVFAVENQRSVNDVDEQVDVAGISEIAHHGFEHLPDEFYPAEFVHEIQCAQFLISISSLRSFFQFVNPMWRCYLAHAAVAVQA